MGGLHVLIVDDSALSRKFLRETIRSSNEVAHVETAPDGKVAFGKIRAVRPNVVVLDIDMPEMDGLRVLDEIRRIDAELPVIIVSGADRKSASLTVEALARGASEFIAKPAGFGTGEATIAFIERVLLPKIIVLGRRHHARVAGAPSAASHAPTAPRRHRPPCDLIVIGVSTGGPSALEAVLSPLPADLSAPVLVVQHMPAHFTKLLAERLAEKCALPVVEAEAGMVARHGIFLAPGDRHMLVRRSGGLPLLALTQEEPVNSCRPSVDVLFRSAAQCYGDSLLAVVLTGMGQDGLDGCRHIHAAGGTTIVQDKGSSIVWGMPGSVAQAGLADEILPLDMIPSAIARHARCAIKSPPSPGGFTK